MKHSYPGVLITFEGIDGAGKTELMQRIADHLTAQSFDVLITKEPGGTHIGRMLKRVLLEEEKECDPRVEFLLFAADRAEHFSHIIIPALKRGAIVLSDRMADSSLAYQGFGRGLDKGIISSVNKWAMHELEPDLTLYLHVSYETARQRREARNQKTHTMERVEEQFWQQVIAGYQSLAAQHDRITTLDGSGCRDTVFAAAQQHLKKLLSRNPEIARDNNTQPLPGQHRPS